MQTETIELKERGKTIKTQAARIQGKPIVVTGKFLKMAHIFDEDWREDGFDDLESFIAEMKQQVKADIFNFAQKLFDNEPRYQYPMVWDNLAVVRMTSYEDWWEKLPQVTRKSVRRGVKRGVTAKVVDLTDELVEGIVGIHNDTTTRQGLPFFHYGKDAALVKREYGTYPGQSIFIGAYFGDELIGIIKMVRTGQIAGIMQILTKTTHYDKRPTNILLAKCVEVCGERKIPYLVYRKYIYGNKTNNTLTEFKRRNGFEKIDLPRYYIPLTLKGRLAMMLKLHLGLTGILPNGAINFLLAVRTKFYQLRFRLSKGAVKPQTAGEHEAGGEESSSE